MLFRAREQVNLYLLFRLVQRGHWLLLRLTVGVVDQEIKVLKQGDDRILMNVAPEVFDHPIDANLTREFLDDPRHHIAVAIDNDLVIGFASESITSIPTSRPSCGSMKLGGSRPRIVAAD